MSPAEMAELKARWDREYGSFFPIRRDGEWKVPFRGVFATTFVSWLRCCASCAWSTLVRNLFPRNAA